MNPERYDNLERRCPRLGGPVSFHYCRTGGRKPPQCWKVIDCWWERFDVVAYLKANLTPSQFEALAAAKPKPKVAALVDLIRRAQAAAGENDTQPGSKGNGL